MRIDTDAWAARLRPRVLDVVTQRVLVTSYRGTLQEQDLSDPPNCDGFGRIRHFRRATSPGWPSNPLPIDPAARALGLGHGDEITAQAFQIAACNWRCWYCFVPFELLSANPKRTAWFSAGDLVDLYRDQVSPPSVLDLTGGQPDLAPEWVSWMMAELVRRGLDDQVYVWSDDNLSTDYFWRYLCPADQEQIVAFPRYGRVGCFKGFNETSFSYNTGADAALFDRQFDVMRRFLATGIDMYAYVTLPSPGRQEISQDVCRFVDRLQELDEYLPLRTIPLEVRVFTPVRPRLNDSHREALDNQWRAVEAWERELDDRYPGSLKALPIAQVPLRLRKP